MVFLHESAMFAWSPSCFLHALIKPVVRSNQTSCPLTSTRTGPTGSHDASGFHRPGMFWVLKRSMAGTRLGMFGLHSTPIGAPGPLLLPPHVTDPPEAGCGDRLCQDPEPRDGFEWISSGSHTQTTISVIAAAIFP